MSLHASTPHEYLVLHVPVSSHASVGRGRWLREEKRIRKQIQEQQAGSAGVKKQPAPVQWSNGYTSGRMTSSLKDSSNAVMRM